jgi:ribosomal protein L7Ae-like RNA K-turn-binding protein
MSFDSIKKMLEMLCYYKGVEITHTFSKDGLPLLKVCCLKNTGTLQVTFIQNQTIEYYEDVEEVSSIIEKLIN